MTSYKPNCLSKTLSPNTATFRGTGSPHFNTGIGGREDMMQPVSGNKSLKCLHLTFGPSMNRLQKQTLGCQERKKKGKERGREGGKKTR